MTVLKSFLFLGLTALLGLSVSACSKVPPLDDTVSPELQNAAYPELAPIPEIYTTAADPNAVDPGAGVEARAAILRARARALMLGTGSSDI